MSDQEVLDDIALLQAEAAKIETKIARLRMLLTAPPHASDAPRICMAQQSDGRWIWTRDDGDFTTNLGWTAPTRAIVGSLASRIKRPMAKVLAAAIRREYGTDVSLALKEGVEL